LVWTLCLASQLRPRHPLLGWAHRALRSTLCLWFGGVSYCLYLVNEPIHKAIGPVLSSAAGGHAGLFTLLWVPAAIGLPILAAAALHVWVEQPAMLRRRRRPASAADHGTAGYSVQAGRPGL